MSEQSVLNATDLARYYTINTGAFSATLTLKALDGASFQLERGKTLAVVGESGCGKSTLARLVTMIEEPTSGSMIIGEHDIASATANIRSQLRPKVQIVFQDPYGSLNPRQRVGAALEEPLLVNTNLSRAERRDKAMSMMLSVGLRPEHYDRYPHMFSGGQRQRIAIARALMLEPEILVLDEPVSALDLSIQAQVLNLLTELQQRLNLAYLFISHDLSVVRHIADEVMVMYLGRPVEHGSAEKVFSNPEHPYTKALLSATPIADPTRISRRTVLKGEMPSPVDPPAGCPFHPRCPNVLDKCGSQRPQLKQLTSGVAISCHLFDQ
ncbi:MAG: dipeptide ABC transporter ATP-binding protein [Hyphomicrobiales bacterium]|nr:dipeptide ABC transporter ATP-binding protein [Hyphomicrobiales bacterium]